ncbi:hypothetical protein PROFUN_10039 [Planoprotostelium fungivorum]|uniref:Uncharacterized protein n=1 Tax=Planoprotostelium fungivorum TaxID=1890364 RepID=A0A2P6NFH4_9EUKA|nr:hypothetical protein PROFUN_10039 [Planoprotostelium fungivorum]
MSDNKTKQVPIGQPSSTILTNKPTFQKEVNEVRVWRFLDSILWTWGYLTAALFVAALIVSLSNVISGAWTEEDVVYEENSMGLGGLFSIFSLYALSAVSLYFQYRTLQVGTPTTNSLIQKITSLVPSAVLYFPLNFLSMGVLFHWFFCILFLSDDLPIANDQNPSLVDHRNVLDVQWSLLSLSGPVLVLLWTFEYFRNDQYVLHFTSTQKTKLIKTLLEDHKKVLEKSLTTTAISVSLFIFMYLLLGPSYEFTVLTPRIFFRIFFAHFFSYLLLEVGSLILKTVHTRPHRWLSYHLLQTIDEKNSSYIQHLGWQDLVSTSLEEDPRRRQFLFTDGNGAGWRAFSDRSLYLLRQADVNLSSLQISMWCVECEYPLYANGSQDCLVLSVMKFQVTTMTRSGYSLLSGVTHLCRRSTEEDRLGILEAVHSVPRFAAALSELHRRTQSREGSEMTGKLVEGEVAAERDLTYKLRLLTQVTEAASRELSSVFGDSMAYMMMRSQAAERLYRLSLLSDPQQPLRTQFEKNNLHPYTDIMNLQFTSAYGSNVTLDTVASEQLRNRYCQSATVPEGSSKKNSYPVLRLKGFSESSQGPHDVIIQPLLVMAPDRKMIESGTITPDHCTTSTVFQFPVLETNATQTEIKLKMPANRTHVPAALGDHFAIFFSVQVDGFLHGWAISNSFRLCGKLNQMVFKHNSEERVRRHTKRQKKHEFLQGVVKGLKQKSKVTVECDSKFTNALREAIDNKNDSKGDSEESSPSMSPLSSPSSAFDLTAPIEFIKEEEETSGSVSPFECARQQVIGQSNRPWLSQEPNVAPKRNYFDMLDRMFEASFAPSTTSFMV